MSIGTSEIKPKDRPVIIVATPSTIDDLAKNNFVRLLDFQAASEILLSASKAAISAAESTEKSPLETLVQTSKAAIDAFESTSKEKSIVVLENKLGLKHKLYWYEPSLASELFKFDMGHTPKDGQILLQHPAEKNLYIIPTEYSSRIAKEKEAAFLKISASLGAKELRLIDAEVKEKRGRWGGSIPISQVAAQIGISANYDKSGGVISSTYSRFGKPNHSLEVPPELQGWVDSNPELAAMVHGRLNANLELHRVTLEFHEGIGIGGEIAAKIFNEGLLAKSEYKRVWHSVWHFEVEYWPKD